MWKHFLKNPRRRDEKRLFNHFPLTCITVSGLLQMVYPERVQNLRSLDPMQTWSRFLNVKCRFPLSWAQKLWEITVPHDLIFLLLQQAGRPAVLWKFFWALCLVLVSCTVYIAEDSQRLSHAFWTQEVIFRNSWVCGGFMLILHFGSAV